MLHSASMSVLFAVVFYAKAVMNSCGMSRRSLLCSYRIGSAVRALSPGVYRSAVDVREEVHVPLFVPGENSHVSQPLSSGEGLDPSRPLSANN